MLLERKVWANATTLAWLNAAIACSQDESRHAIYRTISVEFFPAGVQFVATDGHMLFRSWVRYGDIGDLPGRMPDWYERPEDHVVVMDTEKFALGFMRTLNAAVGEDDAEMTMSVDLAEGEPALGEEVSEYVLTLQALGQRLSCKLYDGAFPDWRGLNLGIDPAERLDGLTLAPKLFAAVGKIKGARGVALTFRGEEKAIEFDCGEILNVRGMLMPMRREKEERPKHRPESGEEQLEHETEAPKPRTVVDTVLEHAEALRPKPGSGIDSVTISSGNRSVTLTANGTGEARGVDFEDALASLRTELLRVGFDVPVAAMREWRPEAFKSVGDWAAQVDGASGMPPMPYPAILAPYEGLPADSPVTPDAPTDTEPAQDEWDLGQSAWQQPGTVAAVDGTAPLAETAEKEAQDAEAESATPVAAPKKGRGKRQAQPAD